MDRLHTTSAAKDEMFEIHFMYFLQEISIPGVISFPRSFFSPTQTIVLGTSLTFTTDELDARETEEQHDLLRFY